MAATAAGAVGDSGISAACAKTLEMTVAERKMSLYMDLPRQPIHRGRHEHGLRDADDGGDRRKGQAARRSRTPLFGNPRPDYRLDQRIGRGCLPATKVETSARSRDGRNEGRETPASREPSLISSRKRQRDARW